MHAGKIDEDYNVTYIKRIAEWQWWRQQRRWWCRPPVPDAAREQSERETERERAEALGWRWRRCDRDLGLCGEGVRGGVQLCYATRANPETRKSVFAQYSGGISRSSRRWQATHISSIDYMRFTLGAHQYTSGELDAGLTARFMGHLFG